ncbi:MAG: 50S ribosomal protein L7 [Oscillospiraceae bacterium]
MSNALNYIGIARKAGSIAIGETNSGAAVRGGRAKVLLLASDASENARHRAENYVSNCKTPLITLPFTKEELSDATGVSGCSMAAFTDIGLAAVFISALAENEPSLAETAELMTQKSAKALLRKREAVAHERKLKKGNAAKSVKPGKRRKNV